MKLIQKKKLFKGEQIVEIVEEKKIRITYSTLFERKERSVDLFDLDPKFDKYYNRPIGKLITAGVLFLISSPFIYEAVTEASIVALLVSSLFVLPGLLYILIFYYQSADLIILRYRSTGSVAFSLWNNLPNSNEFEAFLNSLMKLVSTPRSNPRLSSEEKLELYLRHLEFLANENVITTSEAQSIYERSKEQLIGSSKANLFSIHTSNKSSNPDADGAGS